MEQACIVAEQAHQNEEYRREQYRQNAKIPTLFENI
jgi:hypothetical protein